MWNSSFISNKYPTYRDVKLRTTHSWLAGKRTDDNAEGLWRIHDGLYDFTDFIDHHPGGADWLKLTKGTDITEAFEAHHISLKPERMLPKYKIRDAKEARNITLTLKPDGFYRTLKSRVREKLSSVDYTPAQKTDLIHSGLLLLGYLLSVETVVYQNRLLAFLAGLCLTWTVVVGHNYFHRADNWRMYTFNLTLMNYKEWRVSHALSHHLFPNSLHDLELSLFEPYLCWVPNPHRKNWVQRYVSWIYSPFVYSVLTIMQFVTRIAYSLGRKRNIFYLDDIIPFTIPLVMYLFSGAGILTVLKMWLVIILFSGFMFGLIGLNAAHHHPDITHDGDAMRNNRDWGLYQIDTIIDRGDVKGSQFLVLTHFGEHILHHLFPTLDHGILPQLNPILFKTMEDFEGEMRETTWFHHIIGQLRQLARITPNPNPPKK